MSEQPQVASAQHNLPLQLSEDEKITILQKVKEMFAKENFCQNSQLLSKIINADNQVLLADVFQQLNIPQTQYNSVIELLKTNELNDFIIFNESKQTAAPVWKALRNIIYFINDDQSITTSLQQYLQQNIQLPPSEFIVQLSKDNVKVTINTQGEEEKNTKLIFNKLFMEKVQLQGKEVVLDCVIEEEQLPIPKINIKTTNPYQQGFMPQFPIDFINQFLQPQQQFDKSNHHSKKHRPYKGDYNKVSHDKNDGLPAPQANHANHSSEANNLAPNGQPHSNGSGNSSNQFSKRFKGNTKGKRDGRPTTKGFNGKSSQRVFNAAENDFPTLQ